MNKNKKIAILSGLIAFTCAAYTWGIPAVINNALSPKFVEQKIFENSGYKIDLGAPKVSMGVFPSIWLKSDKIALVNDDGSNAAVIKNPNVNIKLLPLLFKKLEIKKITTDSEIANLVLSKDNHFYIGQYPIKKSEKEFPLKLTKLKGDLGNYNVFLDDKFQAKKVTLNGQYLKNINYNVDKNVRLNTKGAFVINGKLSNYDIDGQIGLPINSLDENKIKINANIPNFDLGLISDYVSVLTKGKIKNLSGIVSLNAKTATGKLKKDNVTINLKTNDLRIIGVDKPSSIIYPGTLNINLNFDTINNGIKFNHSSIISDKIHIWADGKVYALNKKIPQLDITGTVKNTRIEDVVAIIPGLKNIPPEFNLYKLKQYVLYGNAQGSLHFKGIANHPHVNGKIHLSDIYLVKPIPGAQANADVKMNFIGQMMKLNVFVPTANNQNVKVTGNVKIDGSKYSELKVKSTPNVILDPIQSVLIPLHEILKFQLGPVPVMKITKGIGSIDMHSAGKKVDPHLWGTIKFRNATASFNDIHNMVLYNGAGEVVFNDTHTKFKTTSGTINGRPVEIYGNCSVLGKLNVFVKSNGHSIPYMVKVINSSPVLKEVQQVVAPFKNPDGIADIFLNIYGTAKDAEKVQFNKDLFSKGKITLHNATTTLQDTFLPIKNIDGVVNFDKYDSDYDVTGLVRNSKIHVKGTGTKSTIDLTATSDKFKIQDVTDLLYPNMLLPYKKEMGLLYASFTGTYKGTVVNNQLDYNKVKVNGKFLPNMKTKDPIRTNGANFTIKNGHLNTQNLKGFFYDNPFTLSFDAKDIYTTMKISDAKFNFQNFDIKSINTIKNDLPLPKELKSQLNNITDISGTTDLVGTIKNGKITADTDLSGIKFDYKPINATVKVLSGNATVRGDKLYLNRVNSNISSMPAFLSGYVSNIYSNNPALNLTVSAKPTQKFFDNSYNMKFVYPVKIKGDVSLVSKLNGTLNAINSVTRLHIKENSSIYYMGATIEGAPTGASTENGIATNPISLILNSTMFPDRLRINGFNVNQIISSQNGKRYLQTMLNAKGEVSLLKNNILKFNNIKIKTYKPISAKIFNIALKKPTIKQGVFTTDLLLNGTTLAPNPSGYMNISGVDIPVLDSTLRDIKVTFDKYFIYALAKGTIFTNDISVMAKIKNNVAPPYVVEDLTIKTEELNLNKVIKALNDFDADNTRTKANSTSAQVITPDQVEVRSAKIKADKVLIEKATATNFESHLTLDKKQIVNIDDFHFNLANGTVNGNVNYDLKTFKGSGQMQINNAAADIIAENFFDMRGQMYGTVTGGMNVTCTGNTSVDCVKTLSGDGHFEVKDGRMPKLGSLEYLLKAGNLITGGITGLSINGIIDLITPLKTGNFESITGDIKVKNGVANSINVYSKGKDLNMYLTGTYDISTLVADMEIYGSLSKNFSTVLGKIGNASLLRLFNSIPGVSINEINPHSTSNINKIPNFDKTNVLRVFKADVYGDINGSNYVKSFKWIRH